MRRPFLVLGLLWLLLGTVIVLSQLTQPAPITVTWRTETEVNAAGFNVYRATSADGPYTKLNEQIIPGRGSATSGSSYEFVDEEIVPGETYFYRLEDIELDSSATQHAPIAYRAPVRAWWLPVVTAGCMLVGVVLIGSALWRKDGKARADEP